MKKINECNYPKPSPCNCLNIRRASRAVTHFYDKILEPSGLTISQLSLLRNLKRVEPVSISDLAKVIRIDRTTLNRNMKPLMDSGFITIYPGQDPRTRQIAITEKGIAVLDSAWLLWGKAQESVKDYMGEDDLAVLVKLLSKLEALMP
jgi:DNA-binding MarR family transcriptional regulator